MMQTLRPILILLAVLVGFGGAPARAQEFVARQIENLVSTDSLKVKIDGLSGALTGNLRIGSVTVSDPQGPFLTARDLAMDWSPLSVVRSDIQIQSLTAGQIVLDRLPSLPPSQGADASSGGGGLPNLTANVQKLAISEFVVGEAIAGRQARLSLDARLVLEADPTRLETALNLNRLDQPGRITANIAYAPNENRLQVQVDAGEPAGGLVATLLKIPNAPPVQLTVNGSGPLSDFMANGSLNVDNGNAAMLTARVADAPDGRRVTASLNVAAERFAPAAYQAYVRGGANLDASVLLRPDGVIGIEQAQVASQALRLTANGTFDRAGPQTALDVALASPDGGPIAVRLGEGDAGTRVDLTELRAKLAGALSAADIDLNATLPQAGYGPYGARDLTLAVTSRGFDVTKVSGPLTLEANAGAVEMPEGVGARFTEGRVRIAADGALSPDSLTLNRSAVTTGAANAAITGTAALNFSTFDLALSSDFQTLALSAAAVPLAGDRTSLSGRVSRDASGALAAQDLAVRSTGLNIDGSARLAGDAVEANVKGTIDADNANDAAISGKADFALTAKGPTAQPDLDLALNSQGLRVNGRELANLKVAARGSFTGATPKGSVNLSGTLDGAPLTGAANLATLPSGERRITDLAIRQGPNAVTGDLTLTTAAVPTGRLDVAVTDVAPLAALALQQASGDLAGRIDLSVGADDFPVATVDLRSNKLTAAGNTLTGAALNLSVTDYLGKPLPKGTIRANAIEAGGVAVDGLTIDLSQAGDGTRLDARARANGVPVELAGVATIRPTETAIALETLNAAIPDAAVALEQASRIRIANGTTTIDPTVLKIGNGRLRLGGTAGGQLNLDAKLEAVPVAAANPFVPNLAASGTLDGEATISGAASDPQARFRIEAKQVETSQTRAGKLPPIAANANGDFAGGILNLAGADVNLGTGRIRASGRAGGDLLDLTATLENVPVALANGFVDQLNAAGTISGSARVTGSPSQPNATFDVRGTGITAKEIAEGGVPPIELVANGSYANALLTLAQARATIGAAFVEASGTAGDTLNLNARLQDVPVALANGFVPGLKATGTLSGTATATGSAANPNARFDISGNGITAEGTRKANIPPAQLRVNGTYAEGTADLQTAVVNVGDAAIQASGRVGQALDLRVQLADVPIGLANGFVPGLGATGTISGAATATGTLADPNAAFNLTGSGITAERIAASGIKPLSLDVAGRVAAMTATIERGRVQVGDGSLNATGTVGHNLNLKVDIDRLPVGLANGFSAGLGAAGTISGQATATGSTANPSVNFRLSGDGLTANQLKAANIRPVELDLAGRYAGGTATIDSGRIDIGDGSITASGTVGQQLNLNVALDDLPVALANGFVPNLRASGTISGSAEATGSVADPQATFEIEGRQITAADIRAAGVAPLELDLSGRYAGGNAEIGTARITVGDGSVIATGKVGQNLDVDVTLTRLPVALANGFVPGLGARGTVSGKASADGPIANPTATFDIRADDVSTTQTRAARTPALDAVASGTYENRTVAIRTARVTVGSGAVEVTGRAGQQLDLNVAIRNLPASLASAAASGIDPTGTLNGTARATGAASNPAATFDLNLTGFSVKQTRDAGVAALGIRANGAFENRNLRFDTNLTGGGLAFTANGTVNVAGSPRFDVRANGTAPLSLANRILAEGGRAAQGTVRIDVAASGTAAAPNVTGTISTSGATFTDTGFNVALRGINARIELNGQTATIANFSGNLAAGGSISASGTVGLTGGFPANIQIRANNARYADGQLVATTLSAALTITGQLTATPLLAGTINVAELNILVPSSFPSSLARIDVKRRNAPARVIRQQRQLFPPQKSGGGGGINLDLTLNAPSRIFVRGRGLDAQLGGSLRIQGSAASPEITGGFDLQRGRLVVLNKRLDFQRGRLAFTGDLLPLLDFLATSQSGDATINIAVTGPANDPSFNFSSSPALPQDEVLARLIFNQGTTNLSPLQIAQLAEAAAQLAGVGGSTGLLESLRSQIGVDDIDIRTTADGQTAVGVGKYLNDRTYLGVDSTGRASVNIDIAKGLKARGSVTGQGGGEVGIFYENEY
ncbi:translocation/assembly module TamB domain-containing protein [Aureimonas leprariae]|nr:translocation/assembly module TamB domain-containing protein [Aureimonas leprariae]